MIMKKLFLTTVFAVSSLFVYAQDLGIVSYQSGRKADLSDQQKGRSQKMFFYFDEMMITYIVKDDLMDFKLNTQLKITDMRKTITDEGHISYVIMVSTFDDELPGKLSINLLEDGSNEFVGCLEGLYFTGKYAKD